MTPHLSHIVIVGASHAGLSCAEKLRNFGFDGQITVLERSPGQPLQRPPLSKTYLSADLSDGEGAFVLRKADWFEQFNITFNNCAVTTIHPEERQLSLSDDRRLSYDHLILATGARARPLPPDFPDASNIHLLRNAADARTLRSGLSDVKEAVVIGGGYIGLEATASLRGLGINVHVVETASRLLARVASPALSEYCTALHKKNGVQLHTGIGLDRLEIGPDGRCQAAGLDDGSLLECQLVLVGIGVLPDSVLAETAGLAVDNGILVDEHYATSSPDISAIGDVARAPAISPLRIESIHHAQYSASHLAARLTGSDAPVREAWWFWSDQYDVKFQMAGLVPADGPQTACVTRSGRRENSLSVWSYANDKLASVEAANDGQAYMIGKKCLEANKNPDPADINNPEFVLKSLLD